MNKLGDILKKFTRKTITDEINKSYDIRKIFEDMELNLISSMKRAFYFHQAYQSREGFEWEQWQLSKLRDIEKYRRENKSIVNSYAKPIQQAISRELQGNYVNGQTNVLNKVKKLIGLESKVTEIILPEDIEEPQIIREYISKLLNRPVKPPQEESFFGVNDKKLEALRKSVTEDLTKGKHAVLRKMDDVYRQTIYKAQMNMSAGAKTLNQAVDMATKDFLDKGINCIQYKNGARVNIASYAEMVLRTTSHKATLLGEGKKRDEYGLHLVVVSAHANTCKLCEPWQGKILIDDVFSHPSKEFIEENKQYPLLSEAIEKGLLHPNCRHTLTTYFPGVTRLPVVPDGKKAIELYNAEQRQRYIERQLRKWKRFEAGECDIESQEKAHTKVKEWEDELKKHLDENKQLRRDYNREKIDIRSTKEINYKADVKQFNKYKEILGEELPNTVEEFQKLKYNNINEWNLTKDYVKSRSNNMISAFTPYSQYKEYKNIIDSEVVGLTTSNGIKVTGQSKHFIERIFGTTEDPYTNRPRSGVGIGDIKEAILSGKVRIRKNDSDSIKLINDKCIVSINPNTGILIQTNPQ